MQHNAVQQAPAADSPNAASPRPAAAGRSRRPSADAPARPASSSCSRRRGIGRRSATPRPTTPSGSPSMTGRPARHPTAVRRTTPAGRRQADAPTAAGRRRPTRSTAPHRSRFPPASRSRSPPASGNSNSISRSRSRRPICRNVMPGANGPSGVSCRGTIAAARSSGAASTGHHTECSRICVSSSAARSAANGSAVSSTACTSVPNFAPFGRSAIGDATSDPDVGRARAPAHHRPRRRARRPPARWRPRPTRWRGSVPNTTSAATTCRSGGGSALRPDPLVRRAIRRRRAVR